MAGPKDMETRRQDVQLRLLSELESILKNRPSATKRVVELAMAYQALDSASEQGLKGTS